MIRKALGLIAPRNRITYYKVGERRYVVVVHSALGQRSYKVSDLSEVTAIVDRYLPRR